MPDHPYNIFVPGIGNSINPDIIFVGEAPAENEVLQLKPFVGPSGNLLDEVCRQVDIDRSKQWTTNVCKYMVPANPKFGKKIPFQVRAKSVGHDLDNCINELLEEVTQLKPKLIIALGGTALWALTGKENILDYRGSILSCHGIKLIPTYHPSHVLHSDGDAVGYWTKQILRLDLIRANKQSKFKEIILPQRILKVARSSSDLYAFINKFRRHARPSIDIEAINCIPVCIGIAFTPQEGITIPLWNHNNISSIPSSDLARLWILLAEFLSTQDVIGQNFGYDRDKIKRLGFIVKSLASDTMLKAFCINPELPKNLAFNTSIYTEEPFYKNEGMYEGSLEDLFIGCARDACVTKEVDIAMDDDIDSMGLRSYYEKFLLPLHEVYNYRDDNTAIEQIGFLVDEGIRRKLLEKYIEWDETVRYDLFKIAGEYVNTGSWQQVGKLIYNKWNLPQRKGTGEEDLTSLINSPQVKNEDYKRGLGLILEDRRIKKTIGTYLYALPDYDGRMRTSYFLCLDTGRSSTQQQEPPIRPSEEYKSLGEDGKRTKKRQSRGAAFQTMTKHGDIGPDIRSMYVCDPGHVFLQADSAQAEARVIFLLAEDYEALTLIDTNDYHALTASWFVGGTEQDWSKKVLGYEHPNRFLGKTLRHAGHLGASGRRAMIETNTQARKFKIPIQISEAKAKQAIETFHRKQPKIKGVFQAGVIKALEKNRRLSAPVPYGIDAKVGGTRIFFERWGDELFRQAFSYIPQRTVSENTKAAALRIREKHSWVHILCEAHDSLLVRIPLEREIEAAKILKEEFEKPIDFSTCSLKRGKLIIPCEIERGFDYYKLKKFKFEEMANV